MALSVHIEAFGETIVQRDLVRFGRNLVNMRPAMDEVGVIMRGAVKLQFSTEGTHGSGAIVAGGAGGSIGIGGVAWDRLSEPYALWKGKHYPGKPLMRRSDDLYKSLATKASALHVERSSDTSLRFGSLVPYAIYHQSSRPRTVMPFRPPVGLSEGDKRAIVGAIHARAMEGVRG